MGVRTDTQLITFKDWTLRVRPALMGRPRLLLLLHGWTGDENSMWIFVQNFPADYWIVAPRAPHIARPSGYSWRPPQRGTHDVPRFQDLRPAAEALISLVDAYATDQRIDSDQFDIIGFSQGAALTNTLALLYPQRVRRAGVLAGFVPLDSESLVERRPLNDKPFFVAHGTLDEMVGIEYARQSIQILEQAGAQVTFCESQVGHKVSADCLRALDEFFV